jgi:hypothetical protein
MVEHTFGLPEMEAEWNAWYSDNLEVLLSIPGFETAQRFQARAGAGRRYMAMYTIASARVFQGSAYKSVGGGGGASVRFHPAYQEWRRNLLDGLARAPEVGRGQVLAMADRKRPGGKPYNWLRTTGLHRTTPFRGLAVVAEEAAVELAEEPGGPVTIFAPITAQLVKPPV